MIQKVAKFKMQKVKLIKYIDLRLFVQDLF